MGDIGSLALVAALTLSIYSIISAIMGYVQRRNDLIVSAERSIYTAGGMVILSAFALLMLLLKSDFHIQYVNSNTNKALPVFYKFAALWAGHDGALLLWISILSIVAMAVVYQNRQKNRELMPLVIAVLGCVQVFFISVSLFASNPFVELVVASPTGQGFMSYMPSDGAGLNPLLQHWAMVIHPPILFVGYSGFVVPFAFALAALMTGKLDSGWIKATRRWTLFTWMFLTTGILLGGKWAYVELGWGGYWGWDPVENASLMPWLTGTAYLHSVIIQEKRGMLKVWNMSLIIMTFCLCIFGTFLTRSGIVSSVHAFAETSIGTFFSTFLFILIGVSAILLIRRIPELKSENQLDSLISRESSFLFNNLILLGAMFAVLWGTIFPIISQIFTGEQITVGAPFFNKVNIPIGMMLLFLTGVGPLFAWRRTTTYSLKRNFLYPFATTVVVSAVLFFLGIRKFYPLLSFFLCYFVFHTIVQEFVKGMRARRKNQGESFLTAIINLTLRNPRRYGGYIVHFGMILLFVGFTGNAYNINQKATLPQGGTMTIGNYEIRVNNVNSGQNDLYSFVESNLTITKNGKEIDNLNPQRRVYLASQQPSTEIALHTTLKEDLYIVLESVQNDKAILSVNLNPLVTFVWIGTVVTIFGTIVAMLPSIATKSRRRRKVAAETEEMVEEPA